MYEQYTYDFRQFVAGFNDSGDQFSSSVTLSLIAAKVEQCEFEEKISKITAAKQSVTKEKLILEKKLRPKIL
jgi:hypothetical protein